MEVEKFASITNNNKQDDDDDGMFLPGFRFHPTDEELVGFYLRRKVENKLVNLDFISQIDIYKHDPWDLPPKSSGSVGENEWYFFCKRGRKYKNSIRPNRVTGSGFWKATGIDRPIYSSSSAAGAATSHCESRQCIGLKKSLVYYRGSAGKGTKTEWMMHEFRLPPHQLHHSKSSIAQEAEVWTLCRIMKRKNILEWKEIAANKRNSIPAEACSSSKESASSSRESYISFTNPLLNNNNQSYDVETPFGLTIDIGSRHHQLVKMQQINSSSNNNHYYNNPCPSVAAAGNSVVSSYNTSATPEMNELLMMKHADWEDLTSVLGFPTHP